MATPPFNIAETIPADNGVAAQFPATERTFRDIVESWLLLHSDAATGLLKAGSYPRVTSTDITVTGTTWTKPTGCVAIKAEGVGGGGGSGGTNGAVGLWSASGGGASGFFGSTSYIDVTGTASFVVTIGAAGAAGAAGTGGTGGTGGSSSFTVGATSYIWPGGDGSPANTANTSDQYYAFPGGNSAAGTNVKGSSNFGEHGFSSKVDTLAVGGHGGASPYGQGAALTTISTTGGVAGTAAVANTGAGGSGCVSGNQAVNRGGGAGGTGFIRIWEFY